MLYSQKVRTQHVTVYSVNILLLAYRHLRLVQHCCGADQRDWCKWTTLSQQDKCPERETNREECKTSTITTGKHSDLHLHLVLRHWFQGTKLNPHPHGCSYWQQEIHWCFHVYTFSMLVNEYKVVQEQWPHSPSPVIRGRGGFPVFKCVFSRPCCKPTPFSESLGDKDPHAVGSALWVLCLRTLQSNATHNTWKIISCLSCGSPHMPHHPNIREFPPSFLIVLFFSLPYDIH